MYEACVRSKVERSTSRVNQGRSLIPEVGAEVLYPKALQVIAGAVLTLLLAIYTSVRTMSRYRHKRAMGRRSEVDATMSLPAH